MSENAQRKPRTIRIPGPGHPITIEPNPHQVVVTISGRVVADTRAALTVREASYLPVQYISRKDMDTALLERRTTPPTARTRVTAPTAASPSGASARSTPSGPMRRPMPPSPPSGTTSLSIPTVWTPSRNGRAASCFPRGPAKPQAPQPTDQALSWIFRTEPDWRRP